MFEYAVQNSTSIRFFHSNRQAMAYIKIARRNLWVCRQADKACFRCTWKQPRQGEYALVVTRDDESSFRLASDSDFVKPEPLSW